MRPSHQFLSPNTALLSLQIVPKTQATTPPSTASANASNTKLDPHNVKRPLRSSARYCRFSFELIGGTDVRRRIASGTGAWLFPSYALN
jgi:hypothetical protein